MQPSRPRLDERSPVDRLLTVPNVLSLIRLACVPLLLWLLLGSRQDLFAVLVLILTGLSDWLDGKIARWLDQSSRLGELLDPAVDRLYTLSILFAFGIREILPWWVVGVLVARDAVLVVSLSVLRRYGYDPLPVHYLGKAATLCLLYAFPSLLLTEHLSGDVAAVTGSVAVALTVWGAGLYVWSGMLYLLQVVLTLRAARQVRRGRPARAVP